MKYRTTPRTIAAAVAALAGAMAAMTAPGMAHAESSVTLYGDVDAGITYT